MICTQDDRPGPGRARAIRIIELTPALYEQGNTATARWASGHKGGDGRRLCGTDLETPFERATANWNREPPPAPQLANTRPTVRKQIRQADSVTLLPAP